MKSFAKSSLFLALAITSQSAQPSSSNKSTRQKGQPNFDMMFKDGAEDTLKLTYNPEDIALLKNIFEIDDHKALKAFAKQNPNFNWNLPYANLPWSGEPATPLNAAAWFGAKKCVWYLLLKQPGNFASSLNTKSTHNITALGYAQNPPKKRSFPNQSRRNFKAIESSLKAVGAK